MRLHSLEICFKTLRMDDARSSSCAVCGRWWPLPLLLTIVLAALIGSRFLRRVDVSSPATGDADGAVAASVVKRVSLSIVSGPGLRTDFISVPWHEGMTIADLFDKTPGVRVDRMGSGPSAFVKAINGIANQGASGNNWTYNVNGKSGDRSFAVYTLQADDQVLWTFGPTK
jgi:hypothetical protein